MKKDGFTLAELLIVVAIIAVLVSISIPIFTSRLEKAREATDAANLRSAYASVMAAALTEADDVVGVTRTSRNSGYVYTATVAAVQTKEGWQNTSIKEIGGVSIDNIWGLAKGDTWEVSYEEGTDTIKFAKVVSPLA